ncbi:uncharacterized protein IUM83_19007 [Phytophthora cinnamomi]|uniref:uncharacterized protein n=1 Tax=Phytophthora cinnamomi TaxID=4785 RepID=UPI00355A3321|nr:hypothetical protein IUM83_19007 [Phytophthora cinnamomi]
MEHQARVQNELFEKQAKASRQRSKGEPPKFNGSAKEDLELWLFQIEEHFSSYAAERDGNDSRFVDLVVPYLGTDVMSWYREFKQTLGEHPRTWYLFKQQLRIRFRDSDFEYKLLSRLYDLRATGTQQEYTAKFMLLLSQSSLELPDLMKRWLYQQNLRPDTSTHISQNVPTTLRETIEHAQRFEDARKPAAATKSATGNNRGPSAKAAAASTEFTKPKLARRHDPEFLKNAICHICGVKGHIAPDCPDKGKPRAAKN